MLCVLSPTFVKVTVFNGSCTSMTCVDGNDDTNSGSCHSGQSSVGWTSSVGEEYFVIVAGYAGATGQFGITVTQGSAPQYYDFVEGCTVAYTIPADGLLYVGTTEGSALYRALACDEDWETAGIWIRVVGTGGRMRIDTCNEQTLFDTVVSLK